MWEALGVISLGVGAIALFTMLAGLIVGVSQKRWGLLIWSSVTLVICYIFVLIASATDSERDPNAPSLDEALGWGTIVVISLGVGVVALFTMLAGLIVGVARKRWKLLEWSSVTFGICLILLTIALTAVLLGH